MSTDRMVELRLLGRVSYDDALALQHGFVEGDADYVLVLEHPHVYTLGRRADPAHVLVDVEARGAQRRVVDRGGDVTYHGPGQVVCYPVVDLDEDPGAGPRHVAALEDAVLAVLAPLLETTSCGGVGRLEGHPGVFVGVDTGRPAKLAAVGVRSARNAAGQRRSTHGIALNVSCDLDRFAAIVPCGLRFEVTSLEALGVSSSIVEVARLLGEAVAASLRPGVGVRTAASMTGPAHGDRSAPIAVRRLVQAGVDPSASLAMSQRKPEWLRAPLKLTAGVLSTSKAVRGARLVTVCEEAGCPNLSECWSEGTATFMVNGERCTRNCGFCQVDTRRPLPLEVDEPERVAAAVAALGLRHAVVTCVARDDLDDGGASAIAATIGAIREANPTTGVEVLISDCQGDPASLQVIFDAEPEVLNHNLETVARLQRAVRPSASYARSLAVLARAKAAGLVTKSGLMVGLGEQRSEVEVALADLAAVGVCPSSPSGSTSVPRPGTCPSSATGRPRSSRTSGRGPEGWASPTWSARR